MFLVLTGRDVYPPLHTQLVQISFVDTCSQGVENVTPQIKKKSKQKISKVPSATDGGHPWHVDGTTNCRYGSWLITSILPKKSRTTNKPTDHKWDHDPYSRVCGSNPIFQFPYQNQRSCRTNCRTIYGLSVGSRGLVVNFWLKVNHAFFLIILSFKYIILLGSILIFQSEPTLNA